MIATLLAPEISGTEWAQLTLRWAHVLAGVVWIGLLYFFNWVNSAFAPTMDADTKKAVVPELMPRALFWFRWGAAWTFLTGIGLLSILYWHVQPNWGEMGKPETAQWGMAFGCLIVGFFLYDQISSKLGGQLWVNLGLWGALAVGFACVMESQWGAGARAQFIHVGALFGTSMAANVWMRIWPAQQRIITAIKNGDAPDGADVGLAGLRSKHNTFMSVPLLLMMLAVHQDSLLAAGSPATSLAVIIVVGFAVTHLLYGKAAKVPGF